MAQRIRFTAAVVTVITASALALGAPANATRRPGSGLSSPAARGSSRTAGERASATLMDQSGRQRPQSLRATNQARRASSKPAKLPAKLNLGSFAASLLKCNGDSTLTGTFSVSLSHIAVKFPTVDRQDKGAPFSGYVRWQTTVGVDLTQSFSTTCVPSKQLTDQMTKTFVIAETGTVITLSPHIELDLHGDADFTASETATQKVGLTGTLGKGTIKPLASMTFSPLTMTASASVTADLWLGLNADISEGKILGVKFDAEGGVHATATTATTGTASCFTVQPEYHLGGSVYANIWVKKWNKTFLDDTKVLARPKLSECTDSTPVITTTNLPQATTGQAYSTELTTADHRDGSWAVTTGPLPDGLTLDGYTISGTPNAAGLSRFTLTFTDSDGKAATADTSIQVVSPSSGFGTTGQLVPLPSDGVPSLLGAAPNGDFLTQFTSSSNPVNTYLGLEHPGSGLVGGGVLDLPVNVLDTAFGPDGTVYILSGAFNNSEGGELLSWVPGASSATRVRSWGTAEDGDMREPYSMTVGNGQIYVEALSPHAWGSCDVLLDRLSMSGALLASAEGVTDCGAWAWSATASSLSNLEDVYGSNYAEFFDPETLALTSSTPVPSYITGWNDGPDGSFTVVGGDNSSCGDDSIEVVNPSGAAYSTAMTTALGLSDGEGCTFYGVATRPDGSVVVLVQDAFGLVSVVLTPTGQVSNSAVITSAGIQTAELSGAPNGSIAISYEVDNSCTDDGGNAQMCVGLTLLAGSAIAPSTVGSWGGVYNDSVTDAELTASNGATALIYYEAPDNDDYAAGPFLQFNETGG